MNLSSFPVACATNPSTMQTTPEAVAAARQNYEATTNDAMLKRSADSAAMLEYWDLSDTLVDGINALRLAGDKYLPRFVDEDDTEYTFRKKMTKLTNVYRDTVEGLASKPFEEEVSLVGENVPASITEFIENVDGSNNNLTVFASATFFNGINSAIDWIMVDHPPLDPKIVTIADRKASGVRPYWSHILGRNVLEARSTMINGIETLTYARIYEPGKPDQVRIFERMPNGTVRWELREKRDQWINEGAERTQFHIVEGGTGIVTIGRIPLVPFYTARRDGRSWRFFPAMRDAADLQIEVYQQESALKWNKHLGAYSMLAGNGVKPPMMADGKTVARLPIGPNRTLYAPPDGSGQHGNWEFVQPDAAIMKFLADDVKETIQQLRELARQPLTAQSSSMTVINSAQAAGKAKSAIKAWAYQLKDALENAFVFTALFLNESYEAEVNVYTEFDEFLDGKDLESLDADRDRGDISRETLWEEKKRRGVYSPEFDAERETERLLKEVPSDNDTDRNIDDKEPVV